MAENNTMLSRGASNKTEIRFEVDPHEVSVVDGLCNATGRSRTDVFREMLREWSSKKLHEASVICRVAGVNPMQPDTHRNDGRGDEK